MTARPAMLAAALPPPPSGAGKGRAVAIPDPLTWMSRAFGPVDVEAFAEYLESRGEPIDPPRCVFPPAHQYTRAQLKRRAELKRATKAARRAA